MKKFSFVVKKFNLVVFGGDGDLAFLKIYPSLFYRFLDRQIQDEFNLIVVSQKSADRAAFLEQLKAKMEKALPKKQTSEMAAFFEHIQVIQLAENTNTEYEKLKSALQDFSHYQTVYYFSTPSSAYGEISKTLQSADLVSPNCRVVVEKPLGSDLKSFKAINDRIRDVFAEDQIFRIDHYLGKETVQNLMVLRFTNHLFESSWNREHIDNIQITVSESIGVNKRGNYYDTTGALLDMVQNHLLQLLCLVAMEPPSVVSSENVRAEKLKVLKSLRNYSQDTIVADTVKGQYTRGNVGGVEVNSYLEDIEKYQSNTDTFVALKVFVDNWRWKGVPFYVRTGKRLKKQHSEIVINFKPVSHNIFEPKEEILNNKLIIKLQPQEGIELVQMTKIQGPGGYRYKPISLELDYLDSLNERLPDAYERLIIDVIRGNQTLFMSEHELEAAWLWIESITSNWQKLGVQNVLYRAGTDGPGNAVLNPGDKWNN